MGRENHTATHATDPSGQPSWYRVVSLLSSLGVGAALVSALLLICVPALGTAIQKKYFTPPAPAAVAAGPALPGEKVFNDMGCLSCHSIGGGKKVGPDLIGFTDKQSKDWLKKWIANPKAMAQSGDPEAVRVMKEYAPVEMPPVRLTDQQFNDLYDYMKAADRGTTGPAPAAASAVAVKDLPNDWYSLRVLGDNKGYMPQQPIAFSHQLHAGTRKIDCLYCHFAADRSRHAGIPPVNVCLNCHQVVKTESPEIQKIIKAHESNTAIAWVKVHNLPDHVQFNHSAHVNQGISCNTCHGPVEKMVHMRQHNHLVMSECIKCHRAQHDPDLSRKHENNFLVNCTTCHH